MNFREREVKITYLREAILCITLGTVVGLFVYWVFLFLHIDIYGWNFGLVFAPLAAGYSETYLSNRIIGEDIGAISAFILFIVTTFYSFILKNPTLGLNVITIGSVAVILQAAFPTLMNYIILVVGLGIVSYFSGIFKRITSRTSIELKYIYHKYIKKDKTEIEIKVTKAFNESESNDEINSLGFIFMTSTDVLDREVVNLGHFHSTVIQPADKRIVHSNQEIIEKEKLKKLKSGKDEVLIRLARDIKMAGGNAVVDLTITYSLMGLGGDSIQITAMGMGIILKDKVTN